MNDDYWTDPYEREEYHRYYASKHGWEVKECKACGHQIRMRTDHGICDS